MESEDGKRKWFGRKLKGIEGRFRRREKYQPSQIQLQINTPEPRSNTPSPGPVRNVNDGLTDILHPPCDQEPLRHESSTEPRATTIKVGNDNHGPSYASNFDPASYIGEAAARTEAMANNRSADDYEELLGPNKLWKAAYEKLKKDNPKNLDALRKVLLKNGDLGQNGGGESHSGDKDWQEQIKKLALKSVETTKEKRFSFKAGEKNIIVRDQVQTAMVFTVSTKDLVGAVISSDPHAALAWAGVIFIFPLLNTMLQQDKDATDGIEYIFDLLIRCKEREDNFLQPTPRHLDPPGIYFDLALSLQSKTIELYSNVYEYQIRIIRHYSHSTLIRYGRDFIVSDDWKGKIGNVRAIETEIIKLSLSLSNYFVKDIHKSLGEARIGLQNLTEAEKDSRLHDLGPDELAAITHQKTDDEPRCTKGTQLNILNDLQNWIQNPAQESIFWLYGMAGTGKSTIARTVAKALSERISLVGDTQLPSNIFLGATFFFKQGEHKRNHAGVLFPTWAYQLAHGPLGLKIEILNSTNQRGGTHIRDRPLDDQCDELILKPLRAQKRRSSPIRVIFIIDALDECLDITTRNAKRIGQSLQQIGRLSEVQAEILVTSRDERPINIPFKSLAIRKAELQMIPLTRHNRMKDDISIFFKDELHKRLVEKPSGLFIYASTTLRFLNLDLGRSTAVRQVRKLLQNEIAEGGSPEARLEEIYNAVLNSHTKHMGRDEKQNHPLKKILGLLTILFEPLPICSLAIFTKPQHPADKIEEVPAKEVEEYLGYLRSVVNVPDDPKSPVRLIHLSFREFLLDEKRSRETGFLVEPSTVHWQVYKNCLDIMSHGLSQDICNLEGPGTFSIDVPPNLVRRCIPSHLQYACRHWVDHLKEIRGDGQIQSELAENGSIHMFLQEKLLNWLEALSLIGEIGSAVLMARNLEALIDAQESETELSRLIHDMIRFISFHRHVIQEAPLQVYYSAILFSPTTSIIRSLFWKPLAEWILKPPMVRDDWGFELMTLEGHELLVSAVAISPDSKTIVSGSYDKTTRLWEAATGVEIAKISSSSAAHAVAFSPDGQTIAIGSSIVQIYDVETGDISDLLGHANLVSDVCFSPGLGNKILASTAMDKTVRLWDTSTKQLISIHENLYERGRLAFAPDGRLAIASSEWDSGPKKGSVQILDKETGKLIASASIGGVRLWDAAARDKVDISRRAETLEIYSIENTALIVSKDTITFLDLNGVNPKRDIPNTIPIAIPSTIRYCPVVFTQNGKIVLLRSDKCLQTWDTTTCERLKELEIPSGDVSQYTSPNNDVLALA
ncbi:uncharacterized protein F4822DRAFT_428400 [Hypoxylon trugodes]|uniref:uncharacterized protein n=1 Tax=Hypoxylon trugodes TaxID=326681 RepID=UPI002192DB85|nr:uncharacterized protein F4822DRAFT_428400 [Hypoxylon trugodes]KAI1390053.1 hypothetical protein F4822DRAFT_428400 [Hypoxylon trugodes]